MLVRLPRPPNADELERAPTFVGGAETNCPPAIHRGLQATDDNINRAVPAIWPPQSHRDMVVGMLTSDYGPFN